MNNRCLVKVNKRFEDASMPFRATIGSVGADLFAYLPKGDVVVHPGEVVSIDTGLSFEIPIGWEVQIRPRSGLAIRYGVVVVNSPGTIDSDYRGPIKVIIGVIGKNAVTIRHQDRIAQAVIQKIYDAEFWESKEKLSQTERGEGGFGSTG